jgi:ribosome-binding protein aMBF1 (putative translation factor)
MKYKIMRYWITFRLLFKETYSARYAEETARRTRIKEISEELLGESIDVRVDMLNRIQQLTLMKSFKEQKALEEKAKHYLEVLNNNNHEK